MKGIQYIVNESGKRTGVLIDLKQHGQAWEDFYDAMIAEKRKSEPRESLASVRKALVKAGKLDG